jgi:hypothetical protein
MCYKMVVLLCLALVIALAPVRVPLAAASFSIPPLSTAQRVGVSGSSLQPATAYLSIPAAAFTPKSQSYDYENHGRYIKFLGSGGAFRAPVILPNYSTIKRISACFFDDTSAQNGTLSLYATLLANSYTVNQMASLVSSTDSGFQLSTTNNITPSGVNNYMYAYWVELNLPGSATATHGVWGCGVTIEYVPSADDGHNVLSLPGAAFDRPYQDGYNVGQVQSAGRLMHFENGAGSHGTYLAQVSLPQGAVVDKLTLYYSDTDDTHDLSLFLTRTRNGVSTQMARADSAYGLNQTEVTVITEPTIDNFTYTYWAYVDLPPTSLSLWGVNIEYTPHPTADDGWQNISDAAFTPFYDSYDYQNHGRWLFHQNSNGNGSAEGVYVAPVNLPQGATIDGIAFTFYDGSAALNGTGILARSKLGSYEVLASVVSSGYGGYGAVAYPSAITNNIVDNSQYSYFVVWSLPVTAPHNPPVTNDILGCNVLVMFTERNYAYLPLVRK